MPDQVQPKQPKPKNMPCKCVQGPGVWGLRGESGAARGPLPLHSYCKGNALHAQCQQRTKGWPPAFSVLADIRTHACKGKGMRTQSKWLFVLCVPYVTHSQMMAGRGVLLQVAVRAAWDVAGAVM